MKQITSRSSTRWIVAVESYQGAGCKINMQSQVPLPAIFIDCVKKYWNAWFLRWVRSKLLHSSSRCNFSEMCHLSTSLSSGATCREFCDGSRAFPRALCHQRQVPRLASFCSLVFAKLPPWKNFLNVPYCCGANTEADSVFVFPFPQNHKRLNVDVS